MLGVLLGCTAESGQMHVHASLSPMINATQADADSFDKV